jgi:hypothetical protein
VGEGGGVRFKVKYEIPDFVSISVNLYSVSIRFEPQQDRCLYSFFVEKEEEEDEEEEEESGIRMKEKNMAQ